MAKYNKYMNIPILYEDENIVVINKPAGLMVHGDGKPLESARDKEETVVDWFLEKYPEASNVGEADIETKEGSLIKRPGIVHRLDRETSGVLLLAKTRKAHTHFKKQFQDREVKKTYLAWVYGQMKKESGVVRAPIGRAKSFARWTAIPKALRGTSREAVTEYEVIKRIPGFSLVKMHPKTGRTHQIRVHLQYLNYPVVADSLYAGKRFDKNDVQNNLGFNRQALHAQKIRLKNIRGEEMEFDAPLPRDFLSVKTPLH